jgi:hypothetical protein
MEAESGAQLLENIAIGMEVTIQRKRTENTMNGIVTDMLDNDAYNQNGIEVEIDGYYFGYVKKILTSEDIISEQELRKKIEKHETDTFEMKASFKYDLDLSERLGVPTKNEVIKRKIVEEAAGFMNTDGGMICIGVDNNKKTVGLEHDYKLQSDYHPDADRSLLADNLRLEIKSTFAAYFENDIIFDLFKISIIPLDGKEVCCIKLKKSLEPIFVKIPGSFHDTKLKKDISGGTQIWKCWIRADNGLQCIPFDSFLKIWISRNEKMLTSRLLR